MERRGCSTSLISLYWPSHCHISKISNSIAHARSIAKLFLSMRARYNTPNVDVEMRNLRDMLSSCEVETVEDNVRKRPFPIRFRPATLSGYSSLLQKYEKYQYKKANERKNVAKTNQKHSSLIRFWG